MESFPGDRAEDTEVASSLDRLEALFPDAEEQKTFKIYYTDPKVDGIKFRGEVLIKRQILGGNRVSFTVTVTSFRDPESHGRVVFQIDEHGKVEGISSGADKRGNEVPSQTLRYPEHVLDHYLVPIEKFLRPKGLVKPVTIDPRFNG